MNYRRHDRDLAGLGNEGGHGLMTTIPISPIDRRKVRIVDGGLGRTARVGELGRIQNDKRRGAAPPPFDHLLAQGGR